MYILGRRTGDDDSLIYWKYMIISYSREARISNRGCLKKKENQNLGTIPLLKRQQKKKKEEKEARITSCCYREYN